MDKQTFRAYRVYENPDGSIARRVEERSTDDLPDNDVLVKVAYSALNYKDGLSASGHKGITRKYPHTPGIDSAGVVVEDRSGRFEPGTEVIVAGFDLGMNTDGGFGEYIRVPAEWVMLLPTGISLRESMMYGATGFTAALSVHRLLAAGQEPDQGPILVTGAAGGVGSMAVLILKKLGFRVIAATSKMDDSADFIRLLGADEHVDKTVTDDQSGKILRKPRWAGAIDVVGGNVLATILKSCDYGGNVTTCGNIFSDELHTTVYPFILNAVSLLGVDAARCPWKMREEVWNKLAGEWKVEMPDIVREVTLDELEEAIKVLIHKKNRGQVILRHRQ
jgi:putative YhdH/YhfP family quinone oxidoreductase